MNRDRGRHDGFTVIELLISMSIMVGVTGAIFAMVSPGQGAFRVQPEVADLHRNILCHAPRLAQHDNHVNLLFMSVH